jgi:DNA invertase Pin-like site-specific DNA recombinase
MKKAVIYARYSSDLQKDRSIDDQITLCEQIASRHGYEVTKIYKDQAKSAASMFERDGLLELMNAAKSRGFNAVITESLDRLSRDQEDTPAIFKRLRFNEIKIIDQNGEVTDVHIGVGGIVNSMFLKNLADKVKRGMNGRVREGLVPGTLTYGYRLVSGKPGEREIDPADAAILIRIFEEYADLTSTRTIATGLMRDNITSPTKVWNHQKMLGMLSNQIYIGKLVWNAHSSIKNPETFGSPPLRIAGMLAQTGSV